MTCFCWWEACAGPTAVGFYRHVKVVRFQPLAALLMNLFLASSPLSSLKTVGGRDKHKSGRPPPVTEQKHRQYTQKKCTVYMFPFLADDHFCPRVIREHAEIQSYGECNVYLFLKKISLQYKLNISFCSVTGQLWVRRKSGLSATCRAASVIPKLLRMSVFLICKSLWIVCAVFLFFLALK